MIGLAAALLLPLPVLEARPDEPDRPRLARIVYPGYRFVLRYTHSVYDIPVEERFTVGPTGALVLTEIRSTRPEIVGYYGIPGAAVRAAPGEVRIEGFRLAHARLRVRATPIGGRSYADPGCTAPLTVLAGEFGALTLEVRLRPAAAAVWHWRDNACPNRSDPPR